jgi:hypothetical protein
LTGSPLAADNENRKGDDMNDILSDTTIEKVLFTQKLGVLATRGSEYPYTSLVGFVPADDLRTVVFATMRQTRKYDNLVRYPSVSMLVDSSLNDADDFKDAAAVTMLGKALPVPGEKKRDAGKRYLERFPFLDGFIADPACELINLTVEKYVVVTRFQEVREFEVV